MVEHPLILTLQLDAGSQTFFDGLRQQYFPPERNFLSAHLTLFHHLPDVPATLTYLNGLQQKPFDLTISGLQHLGAGVAYRVDSPDLLKLHRELSGHFAKHLIPQDRQPFRPHITVQNKVTPKESRETLALLESTFQPFRVKAIGLQLWTYLGGPWQHRCTYPFVS